MTKKQQQETRVRHVRTAVIAFISTVVVLAAGYGIFYSSGINDGEFVEGKHYQVLDTDARRRPGAPIKVVEFFSYACIHCKNFDPELEEWQSTIADDVAFSRSPVAFSPGWSLLAQAYLTFDYLKILDQNHERLFRQIHDRQINFGSADQIADFVDGHGASKEEFLRAFNSPAVRRALSEADAAQREVNVRSVPTVVVAARYVVNMDHGRKIALAIIDHLVATERGATRPST